MKSWLRWEGYCEPKFHLLRTRCHMPSKAQAQATATSPPQPMSTQPMSAQSMSTQSRQMPHPLKDLTLQETLRVMDVAREMRENRQSAEEMFRRDDLRIALRDKLLRTARMSGDSVTEAEIDAAIGQYMDRLHTFQPAEPGVSKFVAHLWVWRGRIAVGLATAASVAGAFWFLFG